MRLDHYPFGYSQRSLRAWEYHSFDLFDRIDVAVVGDANAHTR